MPECTSGRILSWFSSLSLDRYRLFFARDPLSPRAIERSRYERIATWNANCTGPRRYAVQSRKWQGVESFTSVARNEGGITSGGNDAPRNLQSHGLWKNRRDVKALLLLIHKVKRSPRGPCLRGAPTRFDTFVDCQFRSAIGPPSVVVVQ